MQNIRVLVAHETTLYRQALCEALRTFPDLRILPPARYFEEALRLIGAHNAQVIVSDRTTFSGPKARNALAQFAWNPALIVLTDDPEESFATDESGYYFFTHGYLIDLYRTIKAVARGTSYIQPASVKNVLSRLRLLEESGITSEALVLALGQEDLRLVIDIIRGKSFEDIAHELSLSDAELEKRLAKLSRKLSEIRKSSESRS